ncbi:MAG: VOC family protein [Hydrogenophaga sp.]|nr:VOC family protein [Hydrogenophaga sp.]
MNGAGAVQAMLPGADAMRFYADLLDAKLEALMTYGQIPDGEPVPPEHADKIMHAYLKHPDFELMAGDAMPGVPFEGMKGVMMAITYPMAAEAERIYKALAEGGSVQMPLGETFWADRFGMVTDRFGTAWAVNGGPRDMPAA